MSEDKKIHEDELCCDKKCCDNKWKRKYGSSGACGGGIYGMAFVGALIYYISNATSFWVGAVGVLKAIVWPAMIVYKLLKFLNM